MADNVTVSNSPTSVNTDIPVRTIDKAGEQTQVVAIDWAGSGTEDLTSPDFATESTLLNINSALSSGLQATINSDVLGVAVTGQRNNEIELSFFNSFNTDLITNTTASGGSAIIASGHARYRSGTNATGSAIGESIYKCKYRPAHEQYCFFTAAFTAGVADSVQRIGLFDANNGFFIGYEGTSFGVTLRSGTVDTFTARASWNGDPLDGSSGSKFTRAGTPEAINLTYSNLFRIRFAWLGSASIYFEVFSPDGGWIVFHTIRIPNLQLNPSIQNPELPIRVQVTKTSGASDLSIYTACMAAGTTSSVAPLNETLNKYSLAQLTRAVITGETTAGGGGFVNVKVNPSGSLTVALGDITGVTGQATMANSLPVVIASNQSAIPITDNSGSITVDGTVAATQSGTWNINNISGTIVLPTGAATESTLSTLNGKIPTNLTVTSTRLLVDGSGVTQPISATSLPLPTGAATAAKQPALGVAGTASTDVITVQGIASMTALKIDGSAVTQPVSGTVTANAGTGTFAISAASLPLPSGAATESTLSTLNGKVTACNTGAVTISSALPAGTNNIGDVDVLTLPAVVAATYSTSAVTSVVSAATSTSILASNANRRMAIMVNDSDKNVYVKLGATASTTSFSYKLAPGQTLELPIPVYTGAIDAIWETSPTGSMRVTEIT